jgi:RHS repeat-associated protein
VDNGVPLAALTDLPGGVELTFRRSADGPASVPVARHVYSPITHPQFGPGLRVVSTAPDGSVTESYELHTTTTATGLLWREVRGEDITEVTGVLQVTNINPAAGPLAWTRTVVTERKRKLPDGTETLSGSTTETFSARPWGEALVRSESRDPDAALVDRTDYSYDNATGRLLHVIKLDGSWTKLLYDQYGRVAHTLTPWLDLPASPAQATPANSRAESFLYDGRTLRVIQTQITLPLGPPRVLSTTLHEVYFGYLEDPDGALVHAAYHATIRGDGTWDPETAWSQPTAPNRRTSIRWRTAPSGFSGSGYFPEAAYTIPYATVSPDGARTTTRSTRGTLTVTPPAAGQPPAVSFVSNTGPDEQTVTTHSTELTPSGTTLSTRETTYSGIHGVRYRTREAFVADEFVLTDWWLHDHDADGHETSVTHNGRLVREATWANNRLASETDEEGRTTSYTYFPDGQVHTATTHGGGGVPDTVITHAYAAGQLISRTTTAGSLTRSESWSYAPDGKLLSHTDADGFVHPEPVVVEDIPNRTVSSTDSAGRTTVTTRYRDGRLKSVTGPGLLDEHYTYTVTPEGHLATTIRYGAPDSPRFLTRIENGLGELLSESRSTFGGAAPVTVSRTLDFAGRPVAEDVPGAAPLLHAYSPDTGRLFRSAQDIDANGQIGLASADRVSETRESFVRDTPGGPVFRLTESLAYLQPGAATPTVLGSVREQLSGFTGTVVARRTVTDAHGQPTVHTTSIDRATRTRTESVQRPGVASAESRVFVNGRLVSESVPGRSQDLVRTYDALGRLATVSDPVTGTTTYHYRGAGDLLDSVEDHLGRHTRYTYHPAGTPFARLLHTVTNPAGETVTQTYDLDRRQVTEAGTGTYPVSRLYDEEGRLVALNTFRAGPATPDTTHWHHDPASGLLRAKEYADGTAVHYTYDAAGRLATRTWARGVVTTYGYDPASGDLASITYSDGTPPVSFTRDRLGRLATVTDAAGTQTFALDPAGDLLGHAYTAGPLAGVTLTVGRDALGRRSGLSVTRGATTLHAVTEGYDDTSRLSTHTFGSRTITYGYDPARGLRTETRFPSGVTTATAYDPAGRISSVLSAKDDQVLAGRSYTQFDPADRRTRIESPDGSAWTYDYNKRGEVIRGEKQDPADNLLDGHRFTYQYDFIGNRITATTGAPDLVASFATNALNQYTQIATPQTEFVRGTAQGAAGVTVNGQPVPLTPDGTFNARVTATGPATIVATAADGSTSTETRTVALPPVNFAPIHDADGNLLNDGLWTYTWDAENRLVALESAPANPIPQPVHKRFTYDFQSRRVAEERYLREQPGGPSVLEKATRWINDGWNQTVELLNDRPIRAYVWGLDLSGTREGAGGVGGLLSSVDLLDGSAWDYVSDGNGNVVALVEGATGHVVGRYEYGPFGEELAVDGPAARVNRFRFSSKMGDLDTELVYYGYRYLKTRTGRWVSRDPIEEAGGLNLFAFLRNGAIGIIDPVGQSELEVVLYPTPRNDDPYETRNKENMLLRQRRNQTEGRSDELIFEVEDLQSANAKLKECDCIKKLTLLGHSAPAYFMIGSKHGDLKQSLRFERGPTLGGSELFAGVKWCEPCTIVFRGCNTGAGAFGQWFLDLVATKTTCRAAAFSKTCVGARQFSGALPHPHPPTAPDRWNRN